MAAQRRACNSVVDPGEASSTTGFEDFLEMFGARHSSGDLFDLVWRGGGASGEGSSNMEVQPTSFWLPASPLPVTLPPSEDDMAAWLYPIVSGQEPAVVAGHGDHHRPSDDPAGRDDDAPADHNRERPPNIEEKCRSAAEDSAQSNNSCGSTSRKKATRGARRSHPAGTRNLAEKERRRKINEKLKTLQRLVPGCDDKSNQASTLDQTIRHIKSLQQQVQAMSSFGWRDDMEPLPAVYYPVVPPPPPHLPPAAAAGGRLPPAALAPAVLAMAARGHVRSPPRSIRRWSLPSSGA